MFSLIITIISIALVTALALATIYYGGNSFRQGADAATAARLINEGQQLSGAAAIIEANNKTVDTFAALTTALPDGSIPLTTAPANWAMGTGRSFKQVDIVDKVCGKINEKVSLDSVAVQNEAAVTTTYGCFTTGTADKNVMVFKY